MERTDADVVIRDSWPTLRLALGVVAIGLPWVAFHHWWHDWMGEPFSMSEVIGSWLAWATIWLTLTLLAPAFKWVVVGPRGITFRSWWRRGSYRWREVDSLELGDPADGRFLWTYVPRSATEVAFLTFSAGSGSSGLAILPRFESISASDLIDTIRDQQRRYLGS